MSDRTQKRPEIIKKSGLTSTYENTPWREYMHCYDAARAKVTGILNFAVK